MHQFYAESYHKKPSFSEIMTYPSNVQFIYGDILEQDWSDGTIIFACSTCFDQQQMQGIAQKAEMTRPGTAVMTLDKELPSSSFKITSIVQCTGSWGNTIAYIQIKQ
mmetsp:Transcript_2523/g.3241  ORF Transcript_2523/g.3241 Transcript_2523/m.3241 type:complete len:107 (+) Transcript_2523:3-323(+)